MTKYERKLSRATRSLSSNVAALFVSDNNIVNPNPSSSIRTPAMHCPLSKGDWTLSGSSISSALMFLLHNQSSLLTVVWGSQLLNDALSEEGDDGPLCMSSDGNNNDFITLVLSVCLISAAVA